MAINQSSTPASNILPFPQTRKALRLRRSGMDAAGLMSLLLLERDGEPFPANVHRFDEPNGVELPERSPALILALLLWAELPKEKKESLAHTLRGFVYGSKPDHSAVQLHNLLNRRR